MRFKELFKIIKDINISFELYGSKKEVHKNY